jgi:uncharacterized protein (TIGR03437 family)
MERSARHSSHFHYLKEYRSIREIKGKTMSKSIHSVNKNRTMKVIGALFVVLAFAILPAIVAAQPNSGLRMITTSTELNGFRGGNPANSGDSNGNGRFMVFESNQNIATHNPRNTDKNWEVFLMDHAQRHIFQLTDTKSALIDANNPPSQQSNILVDVTNVDARISNDGKWITFVSNATTSVAGSAPNGTNPGNFNGNASGVPAVLQQDGNTEIWTYQLPAYVDVDLSVGDVPVQFVNLASGTFTQVTNTSPLPGEFLPTPGSTNQLPSIPFSNQYPSIDDDGDTIAFLSTRDLNVGNNTYPDADNPEVFVYKRTGQSGIISQITRTPRSIASNPIQQMSPNIAGNGLRVEFMSNGRNPVIGMTGGCNEDFSQEIHFSDLNGEGAPDGIMRQATYIDTIFYDPNVITPPKTRAISRDGRYIIFYSHARHTTDRVIELTMATFLFDTEVLPPTTPPVHCSDRENTNQFRQVGPRFNADPVFDITGFIYSPTFTDYVNQAPGSIVMESRMNFSPDGTVPTNPLEGLNPAPARPHQIFSYSIGSSTLSRLTSSQEIDWGLGPRIFPSNKKERMYLATSTQNFDRFSLFHFLAPAISLEDTGSVLEFFTGASAMRIGGLQPQANWLTPNMMGTVIYLSPYATNPSGFAGNISNSRKFAAPIQYKGVSLTIDGISAGITGVTQGQVNFIVPAGITDGTKQVVLNNNGVVLRGEVQVLHNSQPDVLMNFSETMPTQLGRARLLNVTDPNNPLPEPFRITTVTPGGTLPTKLRLFLTGVEGVTAANLSIKIGDVTVPAGSVLNNAVETDYPGVFSVDFQMPTQLDGVGNVPVVVTVQGVLSRPAATAARVNILPAQAVPSDLGVWRPGDGMWYLLSGNGTSQIYMPWGLSTDIPAAGDYDGDRKTDFCVFRPSEGNWYIHRSTDGGMTVYHWGSNGDKPAPADYDGDGKTDVAVFRPSDGYWYMTRSSDGVVVADYLGVTGDELVPADYDGDGCADLAVWRNSQAKFWVKNSATNLAGEVVFGQTGDKPVIGDYDGDGKADFATWRSSDNNWRILNSGSGQITTIQWGKVSIDIPVQRDYDGDGKTDIAAWRKSGSSVGMWSIRKSSNGQQRIEQWGMAGDIPVPSRWW